MEDTQFQEIMQQQAMQGQAAANANQQIQHQILMDEKDAGLAEKQLDVEKILLDLFDYLQGKIVIRDEKGGVKKEIQIKRTLSDWGVHRIMQTLKIHINKNNLLSNYNETQINRLMYRFMTEMNNLVLLKYKQLFQEPTFDDCKKIFEENIEDKKKLKMFAVEMLGATPDEAKITKEIRKEMELEIEKEMERIKEDLRKENLKEYGLILEELEAVVYATYNRAWKGEERGSLRRHSSFSEVFTPQHNQPQKQGGGVFGWLRG